jgi:hypothetical protein
VVARQRLAIHPVGQQGVAVVGEGFERSGTGPAVVGGLQHRVGTILHAALGEDRGDPGAGPEGVPGQIAPDRIAHAGERDPGMVDGTRHQVGQVELHRPVDHAADPKAPVGRIDRGHHQGRVDAVEARVRTPPRVGEALHG